MFSLNPSRKDLLIFLGLYPFIIRGLYLVRQSWEPFYMNATCLMDFVRLSSPEHYNLHPLWKFYQKSSTVTCESITGVPIEEFFVQVYKSGVTEFYIFYGITFVYLAISSWCFLRELFAGKVKNMVALVAMTFLSWNQGSLFHLLSHYQNDLYHLNGNVMHHSSFSVGGDNAALVNTLPPGLIINFILNYVTMWMVTYIILDFFNIEKWLYLNLSAPMQIGKLFLQMKIIHPYIHTHHKSWYGPPISTYLIDDYKGHVLCHHVTGYCLGDSPTYSWFYDRIMYLHGKVYEQGYLTFGQPQHYAANIVLDYFLLSSVVFFMFVTVALFYPFMQKTEQYYTNKQKGSGHFFLQFSPL